MTPLFGNDKGLSQQSGPCQRGSRAFRSELPPPWIVSPHVGGGEEAACRVRGGSDVCAAGQADRGAAEGSAGPFRPGGRAGSTWCGRWAGQEVRGQRGRERGAGPWHRALGTPPALGTHRHRAGRRGSARRVARGTWRWPWAPEGQGLLTLSTARILAHMKTSRGRSSRAELCSSFST